MSLVVAVLFGLVVVDVVRGSPDEVSRARTSTAVAVAVGAGVVLALGFGWAAFPATAVSSAVSALVWAITATSQRHRGRNDLVAAGLLVLLALFLIPQAPAVGGPVARWQADADLPGLAGVPVEQALLVLVGGLSLVTTGNRLVRGVLTVAGTSPTAGEASLHGGRWLGPLERIFILALALAGDLTAAAVVIAAKGLLRLPEIRSARARLPGAGGPPLDPASGNAPGKGDAPARPDTVVEYFLVGTFASWLVALLVAGLVRLAG